MLNSRLERTRSDRTRIIVVRYVLKISPSVNRGIYKIQSLPFAKNLKQPVDLSGRGVDIHIEIARRSGQSGDCLDVSRQGITR